MRTEYTSVNNMSETAFLQRQRSYSAGFAAPVIAQRIMPVIVSIFVAVLSLALIFFTAAPVFAAEDNGADAHARSMSMGTGEEPIVDEATTLDYGQSGDDSGTADQLTDDSGDEEELMADEEADDTEEEDAEEADQAEADDLSGRLKIFLVAAVAIAAAAAAAILMIMKKRL